MIMELSNENVISEYQKGEVLWNRLINASEDHKKIAWRRSCDHRHDKRTIEQVRLSCQLVRLMWSELCDAHFPEKALSFLLWEEPTFMALLVSANPLFANRHRPNRNASQR